MNLAKFFQDFLPQGKSPSGTPSIAHTVKRRKTKAKNPNDGRWHMRFNR